MDTPSRLHFIEQRIVHDIDAGRTPHICLRFPPEPNGYLHIGHAKALHLNFSLAKKYGGTCNLRFDDTNPKQDNKIYVQAILKDLKWLKYPIEEHTLYASDHFDRLYAYALQLIRMGKAYVDDHSSSDFARLYKGTPTAAGKESPCRQRSIEDNLSLFEDMKNKRVPEGKHLLRAKIDMASPNMHLRDPSIYRVKHTHHFRTGDRWCIYPMYDFAHGLCDSIEGITHSLCTLEFEVHRPVYDWFIQALGIHHPQQIEFARLKLSHTVLSKRSLSVLVAEKHVDGWEDPRLPTLAGLRRRGYTPDAIHAFVEKVGLSKREAISHISLLEWAIREQLNHHAPRRLAVPRPLKLTLVNYPEGQVEWLQAINNPEQPELGTRPLPFSRTLYIDQNDFMQVPSKKFFRLAPNKEVRLKYAYIIRCNEVRLDPAGNPCELLCTYDPDTKSGTQGATRKVKGTITWVEATHAIPAELRIYKPLFSVENPQEQKDWKVCLREDTVEVIPGAQLEPSLGDLRDLRDLGDLGDLGDLRDPGDLEDLGDAKGGVHYQFERQGYFCADDKEKHVFHLTVPLKETRF